jgi:MFS family permease
LRDDGEPSGTAAADGKARPEWTASLVLVSCFCFCLLGKGSADTFGVFLLPLIREFDWPRGSITGIYAVIMLTAGLGGPIAGVLFDRLGARSVYAIGTLLLALGYLFASLSSQLWQFYVAIGLFVGIGIACVGNVPSTALVGRWFSRRMGLAMGVIWAATGMGTLALVPAAQLLIGLGGWRFTYRVLALAVAALSLLVVFMPWQRFTLGRSPGTGAASGIGAATAKVWTVRLAVREKLLWAMFFVFFFTSVGVFTVQVQIVAYLIEIGINPLTAATAVGIAGLAASAGQMLFGWIGDRLGRRFALTLSYGCTLTGLAAVSLLAFDPALWLLAVYVLSFGLAMGSRGPQVAAVAAKLFGGSSLGGIFGVLSIGMGLGSAAGSSLGGLLHDWTGGYQAGFAVSFLSIVLALSPWWVWPKLRQL